MRCTLFITFCLPLFMPTVLPAQVSANSIRNALSSDAKPPVSRIQLTNARQFYELNGYRHRWFLPGGQPRKDFADLLSQLPEAGLNAADYIKSFPSGLAGEADSVQAELLLTSAALAIVHDLLYGTLPAPVSYDGLKTANATDSAAFILNDCLKTNRLVFLVQDLAPQWRPYISLHAYLGKLIAVSSRTNFKDSFVVAVKGRVDSVLLRIRLGQLAITGTDHPTLTDAIKAAQLLFNIHPDGYAGGPTLQALNVPLRQRIQNLSATLNTLRWMYRSIPAGTAITVNIPSATLYYFEAGNITLESRVIPGKPSTPTPTLSSLVNEVVLYPYWHVPYSIATRELLPMIKKDPGFINAGNYQLLDSKGRIVSPGSVNWASITAHNFPYVLRQSTGCDNALGWIKLNFENPYSVYLHDTPGKLLFSLTRRFFSHGCMRVEKAAELARRVLPGKTAVLDSLEKLGPLKNISPISIKTPEPVAVAVLYQPAWFDGAGNVRFYEDIYRKQQTYRR